MEALVLGELEGSEIMQVIKTMEAAGVVLDNSHHHQSIHNIDNVKISQNRLYRRLDFLHRRMRLLQCRTIATHGSEEVRSLLLDSADSSNSVTGVSRATAWALVRSLERGVSSVVGGASNKTISTDGTSNNTTQLRLLNTHIDSDATLSSSGCESADEPISYNNPYQHPMPLKKRAMWKWIHQRSSIASKWSWLQTKVRELEYRIRQHAELLRQIRNHKGNILSNQPTGYTDTLPGLQQDDNNSTSARSRPLHRPTFKKRRLLQLINLHTAAKAAAEPADVRCICQWPLSGCAVCTGRVLPMHPLPYNSCMTHKQRLSLVDSAFHPVLSSIRDVSSTIHYNAMMKDPQWQTKSSRGAIRSLKGTSPLVPLSSKIQQIPNPNNMKKRNRNNRIKCSKLSSPVIMGREIIKTNNKRAFLQEPGKEISDVDTSSPLVDILPQQSGGSSPSASPFDTHKQRARERERLRINSSYDIDNIVIPHSIAASTKVEVLQYKEILTPKWRVVESETTNGIIADNSCPPDGHESEDEDLSDASVLLRHEKCETLERGKYLKHRKNPRRRGTSSTTPLTPSETPPHTPAPMVVDETSMTSDGGQMISINQSSTANTVSVPNNTIIISNMDVSSPPSVENTMLNSNPAIPKRRVTDELIELIIPPYSPRAFPLTDDVYNKMLIAMPENHPLPPDISTPYRRSSAFSCTPGSDSDSNSNHAFSSVSNPNMTVVPELGSATESDSPSVPPDEDSNDPEWNISDCAESVHHR